MTATATPTKCRVTVTISEDLLVAEVKLNGPVGRKPLETAEVLAALETAKITIDDGVEARVADFVERANSEQPPRKPVTVLECRPPTEARREFIVWDASYTDELTQWQDDCAVNYYGCHDYVMLSDGDPIGTLSTSPPPHDVLGGALPEPEPIKTLTCDASIRRAEDAPNTLVAAAAGRLIVDDTALRIEPIKKIEGNLEPEHGAMDSAEHLLIEGRVSDGLSIRSAGSITVGAAVEAASVCAGGDVVIRRGVMGRRTGLITAGRKIVTKHASDANLVAGGSIMIGKQFMNSYGCAGSKVVAQGARIVGGCLIAKDSVEAAQLGNDADAPTRIVVGVHPEMIREIATLDRKAASRQALVEEIRGIIKPLTEPDKHLSERQQEQLTEIQTQLEQTAHELSRDAERRAELLENAYDNGDARIIVSDTIYGKVSIRVSDRHFIFREKMTGPLTIEKRKIKNVTELVVLFHKTGSLKKLKSEKRPVEELLDDFELEG